MLKETAFLTYFEIIHTTGFIKIISVVWMPVVLWLSVCYIGKILMKRW